MLAATAAQTPRPDASSFARLGARASRWLSAFREAGSPLKSTHNLRCIGRTLAWIAFGSSTGGSGCTDLCCRRVFALRYAYCDGVFGRTVVDASKLPDMPFTSTKGPLFVHEFGLYIGTGMRL